MKQQFLIFATRWLANSLILSLMAIWPNSGLMLEANIISVFSTGLVLTLINALIKPIIILTALPLLTVTLGFFTLLINTLVVYLTDKFYGGLEVEGWFWVAVTGLAIALINYCITIFLANDN